MPRGVYERTSEHRANIGAAARAREFFRGEGHSQWRGDTAGYQARHSRVWRARGKASAQVCVDCGGAAKEWSQVHGTDGLDVFDYEPRCRHCHYVYDGKVGVAA